MVEFIRERRIKATAKRHNCWCCDTMIGTGSPAIYFSSKQEGEFVAGHMHTDCRDAEVEWNDKNDTWGEDWCPLHSIRECDEADAECQWLAENYPAVAARLHIEQVPA